MAGIISTGAIARLHVWPRGLVAQDTSAGKGSLRVGGHRWMHTPPRTKKGLAPTQLAVRSRKGGGEEWVLAIDVGTGGTKAALVTSVGSVTSSAFHPHPVPSSSSAGGPASVEQAVETWWGATIQAVQVCLANGRDDGTVRALAVTGQMQNVILLQQDDSQPIPAAILYSDARAVEEAAEVAGMAGGADLVASITGTHQGKCGAIFGDDDYLALDKFSVRLDRGVSSEEGTFTLCFWVYLLKCSKPGILIRQVFSDSSGGKPFLTIEADRKLALHPLPLASSDGTADGTTEDAIAQQAIVADQTCVMEKWVHIGCEIGPDVARLHVNGGVVGERKVDCFLKSKGDGGDPIPLLLAGGEGSLDGSNCVQGYAHHVRVLSQPTVTNHYVKNPPLELCLDGSTGASDDHEVEEGGDGVWSVVGGKASCRRNFALDVALLDALGRSIHKEMELVAMLVYADSGSPVEKPKDDAEAPLLTTFDGVEFPSTERPIKLIHGRASFKLKISQLSSKCDNRLFRVCFDSPNTPHYPFLRAFSRPIRCVSRNRNHRIPAGAWKQKPNITSVFPSDGIGSTVDEEMMIHGELHGNGETVCNGMVNNSINIQGSPFLPGQPPLKRPRTTTSDKLPNDGILAENSTEKMGLSFYGDLGGSPFSGSFHRPIPPPISPALGAFTWSLHPAKLPFSRTPISMDNMGFSHAENRDDDESPYLSKLNQDHASGITDFLVFKYCLENVHCRAEFLKRLISTNKSDVDLIDFARRVSDCTGCQHDGFQVLMARRLLLDGNDLWNILLADGHRVSWLRLVKHLEESFGRISGCRTRSFTSKDKEFLHQIAGCGEHASKEEFDRLWRWIYPISVALSSPQLQSTWESEDPKWIEGMICRKDAETLLKANESFSSKPGDFLLRFASSRIWPHPDAGALVVSYLGCDMVIYHKLLTLNLENGKGQKVGEDHQHKPLSEVLLLQPQLLQLCRVSSSHSEPANGANLQDASLDCQRTE